MSFLAKLFVDGKEITVLDCSFEISKQADETGKPASTAYGGQIEASFEMSEKDDEFFLWAEALDMTKNGSITFYKDEVLAVKYRLEFTKAHCLSFSANFSSEGRFIANIVISAHKLKFGNEEHTNRWGGL
ncbi:MAG: hypothetical protein L3J20_06410 [Flavobacteriaceae bacterium]|nr:hypothetical protein [Flavobacteriaceae bacterium]